MRLTATKLVAFHTCPWLYHVSYEARRPLPILARRRRFGVVLHAAIAEYERRGRSLERALETLEERAGALSPPDLEEARRILEWRHSRGRGGERRPWLIEGPLSTSVVGHRLDVRVDRLDVAGDGLVLVEYKSGRRADLAIVRAQLAILSYAIFRVVGRAPCRWELELLGARRFVALPAVTEPEELAGLATRLVRRLERGEREPVPLDGRFRPRCPARAWCPRATPAPMSLPRESVLRELQPSLF